jgi:acetylornithine deacetylase/succinyl-diaminopimelate desuccinylase-like protein
MEQLKAFHESNKERFLEELLQLLKIPSISADATFKGDVLKTAEFIKQKLIAAGADNAEICPTDGYPVVYADKIIDPTLPTVCVYGHYDVQPADPLDLWDSGPFEPVVKTTETHPQGAVFARGACDDKGQMYMHVKAFESMMVNNCLPCNVKFILKAKKK